MDVGLAASQVMATAVMVVVVFAALSESSLLEPDVRLVSRSTAAVQHSAEPRSSQGAYDFLISTSFSHTTKT
ncbi:hypothetical protein TYRP_000278 [Tyrophagus putrescentiae]|nr:hypothetical protein TYRP_000278 [Tyrophagus putrescentiae]